MKTITKEQFVALLTDTGVTDANFGRANTVLGSRTVEVEAHFKF